MPKLLEKHFGEGSSSAVQHQVRALVNEVARGHRRGVSARRRTADNESNPLAQFQAASVRAISPRSTSRPSICGR